MWHFRRSLEAKTRSVTSCDGIFLCAAEEQANGRAADGEEAGSDSENEELGALEARLGGAEFSGSDLGSSDIGSDDELLGGSDGSDGDPIGKGTGAAIKHCRH